MSGEEKRSFACFGGTVTVRVRGAEPAVAAAAEARLLDAHQHLSRFLPKSELSRLNRDPRATVPASATLLELAAAVRRAGFLSGGLVDATLVDEIEAAGYKDSLTEVDGRSDPASGVIAGGGLASGAGPRERCTPANDPTAGRQPHPAAPSAERGWSLISVDRPGGTICRPPGLRIDSGGIAKGLLADFVAKDLRQYPGYAIDCCGDIRVGGAAGQPRTVLIGDPGGGEPLHSITLRGGGVATSGIGKRSWVGADGAPTHHLLDPATGAPAFTGVVQATAQAPTAFLAEVYSKLALLSGPAQAASRLPYGGVLVLDDGSVEVVDAHSAKRRTAVAR